MNSVINNRPVYSISNESRSNLSLRHTICKKSLRTVSFHEKKKLYSPYKLSKNIKYLSRNKEEYKNKLSICYCKIGLFELVSYMISYGNEINYK